MGNVLLALNLCAMALMLWRGGRPERIAVPIIVFGILADVLFDALQIGTWKAGVAAGNLILFLALWYRAERDDRWWLILASGLTFAMLLTHLLPWLIPGLLSRWTGRTMRLALWTLTTGVLFIGPWEAFVHRQYDLTAPCKDTAATKAGAPFA